MKIFYRLLLTASAFLTVAPLTAQQKEKPVRFVNGDMLTGNNISNSGFKKADISAALFGGTYYVLVQFEVLPTAATRQQMKAAGIALGSFLPGDAYLTSIPASFDFNRAKSFHINSINTIPEAYKIDNSFQNYQPSSIKDQEQGMAINYFEQADKTMVLAELKKAGAFIVTEKFEAANIILVQYNKSLISTIAALPFVSSISLQMIKDQPLNYNSRAAHAVSGLNALNGKNLNGRGVTVGMGDNADISTHIDFNSRLINRCPWIPADHGTHTSGTVAGAGIINVKNRGMAAKATIVSQYFSDIIVNAPTYVTDYNMVVTNNSYHSAADGCAGERQYNGLSRYGDDQLYNSEALLHVFASGNDGNNTCSPYPSAFGTVKTGWQTAKNILTVGALVVDNYSIASFSGRGPASDGRIKPEITADGNNLLSTFRYNTYNFSSGTSMACPGVTGGLTLLYERYRQTHSGFNPKSALIKAIACNTAEDLGNPGPDFTFGFGMLNVRRGVEAIDSARYFIKSVDNGGSNTHNFTVPAGTRRLKVMLYWNDVAAATNAATTLVNDIDLVLIEPSLTLHRPMTLNTTPANVNNTATEAPDHLNNIEQAIIENPAPGIYSANVNGYNVPFGPQEYVVSYEIIKNGVTVEYPYGGETLVPGETESIRWNAYGNESNTFTVEYSTNNGGSWTTIDNNVPATTRVLTWTVPATATNNGLIRVSRNGTALTDQSNFNFTILGQPVVSVTNMCEGSVQLNWSSIAGATSYDILQLMGDSMNVIGNTASTSFLITGLDKIKTYWLGVAAKNNAVAGRRSISVQVLPNSGPCTTFTFNSDLKIDSILEPTTARQFFSNAANASKPVKVQIKNLGTVPVSGPYDVSFDYGGTVITETVNTTINGGNSIIYTFTGSYPVIPSGYQYNFKAWVTKTTDANHANDTAYKTVKLINNDPITTLPFAENFESMPAKEFNSAEMAIAGNKYLDFFPNTARGRARTFVNTGFAFGGVRALTLDQAPYNAAATTDSAVFNYNLSQFAGKQIRFDFYYKNHGQTNEDGNKVWLRGSENDNWLEAYNLFDNQADIGNWKKAIINVNELLANANPPQSLTQTFQVKLGQEGYTSANSPYPVSDIDDGYTFDNLVLAEAINDVAVLSINSPDKGGCGLIASNPVSLKIKNYQNTVLNNIQVSYQVNGGAIVTEVIPSIAASQTIDYVFTQRVNLAAYADYSFNVWIKYAGDNYTANDSILNYKIHNTPLINTYPYLESFENDNGGFYTTGTNSTWQWGAPSKVLINKAANGSNIWTTNLTGTYSDNETSYLVSPCFDLIGLNRPVLSFSHDFKIEDDCDCDYAWVEYSTDGKTWYKLGNFNQGTNWYNNASINAWQTSNTKWHVASIDIPVTNTIVHFRFVMSSDGGVTEEGIGIDDVRVHEKMEIAGSPSPVGAGTATGPWSNNWVPLNYGDQVVGPLWITGEINSHGQDLGDVTIQPYVNLTGTVRSSNNEYYLDKSFVVSSTIPPSGPVGLRLYFSDAQVNDVLSATNCPTCTTWNDAYELGVTKYKGAVSEEDGTLDNNTDGYYQFISPANTLIIPHNEGYYAEINVTNFGEFWFGKGNNTPPYANNCQGTTISFSTNVPAASYQWQVNTGTGYSNITDGVNYTGTTSNTLQINNVPTSFTGNKYRCIIDDATGNEYTLRFKNLWTGTVSTDWFTAGNWGCGVVPDQYTDVVIPGGLSRYPILTGNTAVRSLRVLAGVPLIINTGIKLEVKGL